ncbi:hypothetical protein FF100_27150 [Methylobacterium terricola]|uniref:Uncharacterized protein n=1 Tax=Methylobacterium terricola TaxID=2583531 RepID=A0A5C4LC14_9HYPH|nr:hypothetical protein FF100_27150 [Methylobacterium terricola]
MSKKWLDMGKTLGSSATMIVAPSARRTRVSLLAPRAGRGLRLRSGDAASPQGGGEGVFPNQAPPDTPPHPRLPPRRADDKVAAALSPPAGRGGCAATPPPAPPPAPAAGSGATRG